jgi:N-acetylglutamate synthase-like GNAT family acetyltransferase
MGIYTKMQTKQIEIIDFDDQYLSELKTLSYEWLRQYSLLEPEDERILCNPKEVILKKGGYIYFARYGKEIVGTVSLIKIDDATFELAKLAVTRQYRGHGIGRKLVEHCLEAAKKENIRKIILFTNHKLISAIGPV